VLWKAVFTGKVLKAVAAGLLVVGAAVVGLWKRVRGEPDPTGVPLVDELAASPVQVPEQADLGPVMDHLTVDMQKKSS
jgi:hypothetical protein